MYTVIQEELQDMRALFGAAFSIKGSHAPSMVPSALTVVPYSDSKHQTDSVVFQVQLQLKGAEASLQ